ncbi:MAG: hypothetical protein JNM90_16230 [Burkholderiales bacterium]|nr:hypothetical protein [Burkholderiales bacterium]
MTAGLVRARIGAWLRILAGALGLATGGAWAGYITTPSLTDIYGQAAFTAGGGKPIAINWLPPGNPIISPALASLDSNLEVNTLLDLFQDVAPVATVFFVDAINFCGAASPSIIGCADRPGHTLVVQSAFAAGAQGALLIAHELAHNMGLGHVTTPSTGNLMNPVLNSPVLAAPQVNVLRASALVQTGGDGSLFVNLRPIAVVSAIPEPGAWLLLSFGVLVVGRASRRRGHRTARLRG